MNCKNAKCKERCPVGVDIPAFIQKIKEGDLASAAEIIKLTNNLPAVCGRVCPQEAQCEAGCIRGLSEKAGGAVAIGTL